MERDINIHSLSRDRVGLKDDVVVHESQLNGISKQLQNVNHAEYLTDSQNMWVANGVPNLSSLLEHLEEISILQHLDVVEVCLGWERNNRYSVYNRNGEQILYIYESAQCIARQCYGSLREFTLVITDNDDNHLLFLHRPLRCSSRCFYACCCLQQLSIISPQDTKESVGVVQERWSLCNPKYEFSDSFGSVKFTIQGDSCHYRCCCDMSFIVNSSSGYEMAKISKKWNGCKSIIGASNEFTIKYFDGLSKQDKALILGSTFLLDFNYFERHGKCF
ncbi:Phospholipid scramblase 2 [Bulinus truncatus]|nr:Phospholipid scramblase 2 [Bulinus truncatus]